MVEDNGNAEGSIRERTVTIFLSRGFTQSLPENLADVENVVLDVNEDEPLQRIFERAQALSGTTVPPESPDRMLANASPELTLSTEPDDDGRRGPKPVPGALVGSDGRLKWGHFNLGFGALTVGDFRRSRELGLLDADPYAFVFASKDPIGNGVFLAWNELQDILIAVGSVGGGVTFAATTGGKLWQAIARFANRVRRKATPRAVATNLDASTAWLVDFFERNHTRWVARGANEGTDFIVEVCRHKRWDAQTLAQVLQIDLSESQMLLEILGYEHNRASDRYELSSKQERTAVRAGLLRETLRYDPATNEVFVDRHS